MDMNIVVERFGERSSNIVEKVKKAIELGFTTIAMNTIIDSSYLNSMQLNIPEPLSIDIENCGKNVRILRRLTAVVTETYHCHHLMQSPVTKLYDIIAVEPHDEKILQHVCGNMDIEIIAVNMTQRIPYFFKRTYMNQAAEKGIVFEIQYAPCVRSRMERKWVFANACILTTAVKKRSIIVSSGAWKIMELRGVQDVINLGLLFELNEKEMNECVRKVGQKVLAHSNTRLKSGCGFVSMQEISKFPKEEKWIVDNCRMPRTALYMSSLK